MTPSERVVVADLLRRFERPRSYAGDYEMDFANRIANALKEHNAKTYRFQVQPLTEMVEHWRRLGILDPAYVEVAKRVETT